MKTDIPDGIDSYIQKWRFKYRHINAIVCFHTTPYMQKDEYPSLYPDWGIWNGYIIIQKKAIPKEFDYLIPKIKKYGKRKYYEYNSLDDIFDLGITFFELLRNDTGAEIVGFKIGNDYAHSWNHGTDFSDVKYDIERAIDRFIDRYPKYRVWSHVDGKWIINTNIDGYNERARKRLFNKQAE